MTRPTAATDSPAPPPALAGDWQVDELPAEFVAFEPGGDASHTDERTVGTDGSADRASRGRERPEVFAKATPVAHAPGSPKPPPSPVQLLEAMLFVGGPPLTAAAFQAAARVPDEVFHQSLDALTRRYAADRRPYTVRPSGDGYVLAVAPRYLPLRERLFGGPKQTRLSPPALDVLSAVAYRQPVSKADLDALLGRNADANLRQLVRLGLTRRSDDGQATYTTGSRFLELFGLSSLDDLPRLGAAESA